MHKVHLDYFNLRFLDYMVEHLFICVLTILIFSSENAVHGFAHFPIGMYVFFLINR